MKFENNKTAHLVDKRTPYIQFPVYEKIDGILHGFSTRFGGVSKGIYATMNLGFGRGDFDENVRENYRRICKSIGMNYQHLVYSDQVHKTNIRVATKKDWGMGIERKRAYREIDGLITNEPEVGLVTAYADCVPLFFVDPVKRAIGLSHAGWRGTVGKIGAKTVQALQKQYGCEPKDILVVIGPSICQDCYEVSEDVAKQFEEVIPREILHKVVPRQTQYQSKEGANPEKYQLDLWEANKYILMEAGVPEEQITISGVCTCCNSELFHSHRASKGQRGSLSAFLCLAGDEEK